MQRSNILIYIFIATIISGCFPEDEPYPIKPVEGFVGEINASLYEHQTFYSLSENTSNNSNFISEWDLGFRSSKNEHHVILNSGDLLKVANLGAVDFENTNIPDDIEWLYDASSGNLDSLAISNWVDTLTTPYTYSQNVYAISKNGEAFKKFKLTNVNETRFTIITSPLDVFEPDTIVIEKDKNVNYTKLSLQNNNEIVAIEPNSSDWDLQFTTYQTIIPDDFGVPTPYIVRGVLLNPQETMVAKYFVSEDEVAITENEENDLEVFFVQLNADDIENINYSVALDAIGHDWKVVDIDFETGSGTAAYKTDQRKIYILKTQTGQHYKLRFISYYKDGVKGFPTFQYALF